MKKIIFIGLFLEPLEAYWQTSMLAKAKKIGAADFHFVDLRQFGGGSHRQVDDTPYGGGLGMILRIEPLVAAIKAAKKLANQPQVVLLTPRGETFNQSRASQIAKTSDDLILLGGYYEGYDERLINYVDGQISIGRYVLTNSILPSLVLADAVVRLLPEVLADPQTALEESFSQNEDLVEYPQYTKPAKFDGHQVPAVLLSGHHQNIAAWRQKQQRASSRQKSKKAKKIIS